MKTVRLHDFELGKRYTGTIAGLEFQLNKNGKYYAYNTTETQINHIPAKSIVEINPDDRNFIEVESELV